jgi:DNA replication and repair protein RecF
MDGLFTGAAAERRRFLDRLALALDAEHMTRVNALERALRSRNRLLEEARPDSHWLDAIEHETAELAVAVTASRVETVGRLQATLAARKHPGSAFPAAEIALDGWMERLVPVSPAVEVEDRYRAVLRDNRARDAAAHRTLDGPHLRSRRHPRGEANRRRRRLDRRAEGVAHRARSRPCRAAGRNVGLGTGAAAGRGRRAP